MEGLDADPFQFFAKYREIVTSVPLMAMKYAPVTVKAS
jgi:hypothetical protein